MDASWHVFCAFHPAFSRCLFKELVSIHERDPRYDPYLNSQECLFHPSAGDSRGQQTESGFQDCFIIFLMT